MKVKTTTIITELEASAQDLRESQTLAQNLASFLSRVFQNHEPLDDECEEDEE